MERNKKMLNECEPKTSRVITPSPAISMTNVYLIVASVNELVNLAGFKEDIRSDVNIVVVDEGDEALRSKNDLLLKGLNIVFNGPSERREWFRQRFGSSYEKYLSVIPEKCHAETSFGFLVAYEEGAEVIIELDDDVYRDTENLIHGHLMNLYGRGGVTVESVSRWYNTLDALELDGSVLFPRGHPYEAEARRDGYRWFNEGGSCVLNMGLWRGQLDLDALTILHEGGLDGRYGAEVRGLRKEKVIVARGTYLAVCSMNTAFRREIIPAFYQLYMKYLGVDRFDDIWSGLFLKSVADHMGDRVCLGRPLVYHDKRPRSTFSDLRTELEGMAMNEVLWKLVDSAEINGNDYFSAYLSLISYLKRGLDAFVDTTHRKFMEFQLNKMKLWLEVIDKIG